jgi:hypothetical protein
MADRDAGEGTAEEEWRFPLSEFEGDGDADGAVVDDADDADDAGEPTEPERIEPGDPSPEGVVFVLLGVAFTLFVVSRLFLG